MSKLKLAIAVCAFAAAPTGLYAQVPYVGEMRTLATSFCPTGWIEAAGQLLPISENETLFQLIGTTYGGDGQVTFAAPDLRRRALLHRSADLPLGATAGAESTTLTVAQMPSHAHAAPGAGAPPVVSLKTARRGAMASVRTGAASGPAATQPAGGGQPHEERQPYLAMINCMSLFGIFPSPN